MLSRREAYLRVATPGGGFGFGTASGVRFGGDADSDAGGLSRRASRAGTERDGAAAAAGDYDRSDAGPQGGGYLFSGFTERRSMEGGGGRAWTQPSPVPFRGVTPGTVGAAGGSSSGFRQQTFERQTSTSSVGIRGNPGQQQQQGQVLRKGSASIRERALVEQGSMRGSAAAMAAVAATPEPRPATLLDRAAQIAASRGSILQRARAQQMQ